MPAEPAPEPEPEEYVLMIPISEIEMPNLGDQYGRITISGTNVDAPVFWGDDYPVLNRGVGTHHRSVPGAWLPGFGRTVMLAGHRNTDFLDLFSAEIGEFITIETHYGTFVYEIVDIAVFHMSDTDSFDFTKEYENIIVYTCYPRDFVGRATNRLFVYGILVSGTQVDINS
jgi:sortase A